MQCPEGLLTKHFEKLIQCDIRLNLLSQQPEVFLDSPHFDTQSAAFENPENLQGRDLHQVDGKGSASSCFQNMESPLSSLSPSFEIEHSDPPGITWNSLPYNAPSPSSGTIRTRLWIGLP